MKKFAQYAVGLFYLFGGPLIHLYCLNFNRQIYAGMADMAWPLYRAVWTDVILPFLAPWVTLLILFEIVAGLLSMSSYPKFAARGQILGILFNLFLVPFWWVPFNMPNLLMAALHGVLFRAEWRGACQLPSRPAPI
jgi:hypothetical protein